MSTLLTGMPFFGVGFAVIILTTLLFALALSLVILVARYRLYKKCGYEGWESLIPFYSSWILVKISGVEWWFYLIINAPAFVAISLMFPLAGLAGPASLVGYYFINYNIAIKFDKDPVPYALGLTLIPMIFYPILAFGNTKYKDIKVSPYGPVS